MFNWPQISCLSIIKKDTSYIEKSIENFITQTYPNKELILVYENKHLPAINPIIQKYKTTQIHFIKAPSTKHTEELTCMTLAIQKSQGNYICLWDIESWYNPIRISKQFFEMKLQNKRGSILKTCLVYDRKKNNLYDTKRTLILEGWEDTLLHERKSFLRLFKGIINRDESIKIKNKIFRKIISIPEPEICVYKIHILDSPFYAQEVESLLIQKRITLLNLLKNAYLTLFTYKNILQPLKIILCFYKIGIHFIAWIKYKLSSTSKQLYPTIKHLYTNQNYIYKFYGNSCLNTIHKRYADITINNEPYFPNFINTKKLNRKYKTGIVMSIYGRSKILERCLLSIKHSLIKDNIILVIVDETSSTRNDSHPPHWDIQATSIIKKWTLKNIPIIKIYKYKHGGICDSIKNGFEILITDFQCDYLMILDSDTLVKPHWYKETVTTDIFTKNPNTDIIISGMSKDDTFSNYKLRRNIGEYNDRYYVNNRLGAVHMYFKKEIYLKYKHLFKNDYFDAYLTRHNIYETNGLLLSLKESVIEHIGNIGLNIHNIDDFDIAEHFHFSIKEIPYVCSTARKQNIVPPIIHRLLLYDNNFPKDVLRYLHTFKKYNNKFYHVLWKEKDILSIMNSEERKIYNAYKFKIQKSDYARYIVLKYYGGLYCDFDIMPKNLSLFDIYEKNKDDDLFFEETSLSDKLVESSKDYKIRNGQPENILRLANYIIMAKPNSIHLKNILDLCKKRKSLSIHINYDILYTTGPDIISTYYSTAKNKPKYLPLHICDTFFKHENANHWNIKKINTLIL